MNTENEKIKTKIDAEIVNSNTKMYTVSIKQAFIYGLQL